MSFNQYLLSKNTKFTLGELLAAYREWLEKQGFKSPWIDMYLDVLDSLPSIERAGIIWVLSK